MNCSKQGRLPSMMTYTKGAIIFVLSTRAKSLQMTWFCFCQSMGPSSIKASTMIAGPIFGSFWIMLPICFTRKSTSYLAVSLKVQTIQNIPDSFMFPGLYHLFCYSEGGATDLGWRKTRGFHLPPFLCLWHC